MGVPMLISKHALNCCKGSANREKYKNKSHLFFISEGPPTLLKYCLIAKITNKIPQKLVVKCHKS